MAEYKSTGEVARALGLSEAALQHQLRRNPDLAPTTKIGGRRAWSPEDIQRVAEARARKGA